MMIRVALIYVDLGYLSKIDVSQAVEIHVFV